MSIINLIAAVGERNSVIGRSGKIPFSKKLTEDLRFFADTTAGHPVLFGHRTWLSIPEKFRPLDRGRTSIVLSRTPGLTYEGAHVVSDFDDALYLAERSPGGNEVFIGGGEWLYRRSLPCADYIIKTLVDEDPEGDTFFPEHPDIMCEVWRKVISTSAPRLTVIKYARVLL